MIVPTRCYRGDMKTALLLFLLSSAQAKEPLLVIPVRATYKSAPNFTNPDNLAPPNLKEHQLRGIAKGLSPDRQERIKTRLRHMDRWFVDNVPESQWNEIIAGMDRIGRTKLNGGETDQDAIADAMLKHAAEGLRDPLTKYMTQAEYSANTQYYATSYKGVGIQLSADPQKRGVIAGLIFRDSPAKTAGIKAGDLILSVDGKSLKGKSTTDAVALLKGEAGTQTLLAISRGPGTLPTYFRVTRGEVKKHTVFARALDSTIGYVRISVFRDSTDEEFNEEVQPLKNQGIRKLIIDLRGNPGGRVWAAAHIASEFYAQGTETHHVDRRGSRVGTYEAKEHGRFRGFKVVILTDENSASMSEALAVSLRDNGIGTLVGGKTYGKGTQQSTWKVDGGRGERITNGRSFGPNGVRYDARRNANGSRIHGSAGLKPDYPVAYPAGVKEKILVELEREMKTGETPKSPTADPALYRAIQILSGPTA